MTKPFVSDQPEERVIIEVSKREALAIQEMRGIHFGKVTVHIANGIVVRAEPNVSKLIDEKTKLTIPIVENKVS